jgi:hypothetical protein
LLPFAVPLLPLLPLCAALVLLPFETFQLLSGNCGLFNGDLMMFNGDLMVI